MLFDFSALESLNSNGACMARGVYASKSYQFALESYFDVLVVLGDDTEKLLGIAFFAR